MKKLLVFCMTVLLLCAVTSFAVSAAEDPTVVVSSVEAKNGDTIDVTVTMKNNPGLQSTKIKVLFDNTALELKAYKAGDFSASGYSWGKVENANANGGFVINWCDAISDPSTAELLATLTFEVKADAVPGTYTLGLEYSEDDLYTTDYENVAFGAAEGSVKILCDHEYDAVCDPACNKCGETRDVHTDNIIHFDAVDPACHYIGNIEYWFCPDCEMFWADAALTQVTNSKSVILPALGGETSHIEAVAPACHYNGNIEYWVCYECEQFWQDEALTQLTNSKNVILPATGSENLKHVEAVEATCMAEGNIEYWFCSDCEQYWQDEALTQLTNSKNVQLGLGTHNIVHIDAAAPACHYIGNIEYWYCTICECFWADEALTQVTNSKSVILPALGGDVIAFEAIEPACHYNGRIAYWFCPECEQFWQDEALTQLTNSKNVILPATGSENLKHVEAVAPSCMAEGNVEYWFCPDCEQFWVDEALTKISNSKSVLLGLGDHNIVHIDAVDAGCHYIGNIEYWYCTICEVYWQNAELTQITNSKSVIIPALGSENLKHVEAKAPTATENGNIEYWFCPDCEQFWQDEALTQLTNSKRVILPATGEVDTPDAPEAPETDKPEVEEPESPETGDSTVAVVVALMTLIASGAATVVLKKRA